jgi:hypothetical protein
MDLGRMLALCGLLLAGALGCRADCESNCEEHKECANASETWRLRDCRDYCENLEKANESGCEDQYDALLSCENSEDDVCTVAAEQACARQRAGWLNCTKQFQ